MTFTRKRKVSVVLDEDLVAKLEAGGEALSAQTHRSETNRPGAQQNRQAS